ncbi:DEAD/DEAH box helicase [Ferrovum sp.]|uniref:DEAD/DEAH box helicase n=1 Tax=Ferrovum sp. TaxID=2609467 RepID=UPI0026243B40|nr:DEAD/DEAH box helicase [Ferrovum sp.]
MKESSGDLLAPLLQNDEDPHHRVMLALALLWSPHPRTALYHLLRQLDFKHPGGRMFTMDEVRHSLQQLAETQQVVESSPRQGYYRLTDSLRNVLYEELLDGFEWPLLQRALYEVEGFNPHPAKNIWPIYERDATVAIVRLALLTGMPQPEINKMASSISRLMDWQSILDEAVLHEFSEASFARIDPAVRWELCYRLIAGFNAYWKPDLLRAVQWTLAQAESDREKMPVHLRLVISELLLHRGERDSAGLLVKGLTGGWVDAINAYALAQEGEWAKAQNLFETGLKKRHSETGVKKRVLPFGIVWIYPLVLLAQQTPKHLDLARKFCISEAGKRNPDPASGWGLWVRAIDIRRGDAEPDKAAFGMVEYYRKYIDYDNLWRVLLMAWLGLDTLGGANQTHREIFFGMAQQLADHFEQCGFRWLADLVKGAKALICGEEPPPGYFVGGNAERWRELLFALQSLGGDVSDKPAGSDASRFIWMIDRGKDGALKNIVPLEQKYGVRGWNKPKEVTLAKLAGNPHLLPWDAKVANCIRTDRYARRGHVLDLPGAVQALIGHPVVVLSDKPEQLIELSEGRPEIEVIHKGDKITMKVVPPLREGISADSSRFYSAEEKREAEALRQITLVQDSAQRVRLVRFNPAQRRVAQLLAGRVVIPASAQNELQAAMKALTSHFQLQADYLQAAHEVPAEARLRAELSPLGDGLLLRLVATPLGAEGPRMTPGSGRARLMASVGGKSLGTTRPLAVERTHLEAVLDALPFLEACEGDRQESEWEIVTPEEALASVEVLPTLPAILALDWPKGKAVRVVTVDTPKLVVQVRSERDWFRLNGEARVDEGLTLTFETLLAASLGPSRFIAMGDGVYAALTHNLKERLKDLAVVMETDKLGARMPHLAAAWVDEALEGMAAQADEEFHDTIKKLHTTRNQDILLPRTLQTDLRPYQEEGYLWASRLAQAGFGACLADDMGLGKTLQSLALLLARAEGGPALVIAPTSVCGNWMAEATRFAPSLNFHLYSEVNREAIIPQSAPFDVVVASYGLVQQASEQFAAKHWHTLIADEAQAIKNSATKRSQAVFRLDADFRLALSGTPVENRLAELWSIMRFVNPGLLGTLSHFNERFALPIERDKDRDAQHILRRLIAPFLLRRTKAQVLQELPPRTEMVITIEPGKEEAAHYEAVRRQAIAEADTAVASHKAGQARMNILAQLTRLRRAACDPRIITPTFAAAGGKIQTFTTLALELVANGHKALVFSQFVDFLTLLRDALEANGITYQYLDGSTPAAERTKRIAAFQAGKSDLFLISLKAGGFGLNLTAADYVVITDPWWNPAAEDQAMGRAHRMGQQRPVTVYRLVMQGTVEELIVGLHNDKRALAEGILGEGEAVSLPSTDELISLIKGGR